jgi:hypothetical protein
MVAAMVVSRSCQLEDLARSLQPRGKLDAQYRRVQRFLANERVDVAVVQRQWARVVVGGMKTDTVRLLVDMTDLSDHLGVVVVGVWSQGGCVPLAWRCFNPRSFPAQGQVAVIVDLLSRVMAAIPPGVAVWLLADRGIGTSPDLVRQVEDQGVYVLFRVQGSTRFRDRNGTEHSLKSLGVPGMSCQLVGDVFKKAGWLCAHVTVAWDERCDQPWCLVSSAPVTGHTYAIRFQQEVAFRDLKSDGLNWQRSHVWMPEHADRLLLALTLAYWMIIALGQQVPRPSKGRQSRHSAFRRGLDLFKEAFHPTIAAFLAPSPPVLTCVVQ